MGSSAKRKKDKKKDFQKAQLKVGKAKAKPSNFTDTSFKAKSIVVNTQSLSVAAPTASAQFTHHVSSLKHRSDSQRAESLAFLASAIGATPIDQNLAEPLAIFLPKLLPLILDGSNAVRQQLLKVFRALGKRSRDVRAHVERVLLYAHAGMSHLSSEIRVFTVDVLDWLLDCAGQETVGCAGGWVKTLNCFMSLFGWRPSDRPLDMSQLQKGWSSVQKAGGRLNTDSKILSRHLSVFGKFLVTGLCRPAGAAMEAVLSDFPLRHARQHMLPASANAYAHLNLFGSVLEGEAEMKDEREDRQRVFKSRYEQPVAEGTEEFVKEGGDVGRAAASVRKATLEGLKDLEASDNDE